MTTWILFLLLFAPGTVHVQAVSFETKMECFEAAAAVPPPFVAACEPRPRA